MQLLRGYWQQKELFRQVKARFVEVMEHVRFHRVPLEEDDRDRLQETAREFARELAGESLSSGLLSAADYDNDEEASSEASRKEGSDCED